MTLVELIAYFRSGRSYEDFCQSQSLDVESEVIGIYMQMPFDVANDVVFSEMKNTDGIEFTINGIQYFNLFDFYYFMDAVEESNERGGELLIDKVLASVLLSYAINDA